MRIPDPGRGPLIGFLSDHRMVVLEWCEIRPRRPIRDRSAKRPTPFPAADRIGHSRDPVLTAAYDARSLAEFTLRPYLVNPAECHIAHGHGKPEARLGYLLGCSQSCP